MSFVSRSLHAPLKFNLLRFHNDNEFSSFFPTTFFLHLFLFFSGHYKKHFKVVDTEVEFQVNFCEKKRKRTKSWEFRKVDMHSWIRAGDDRAHPAGEPRVVASLSILFEMLTA